MTRIRRDIKEFIHHRYKVYAKLIPKGGSEEDTIILQKEISDIHISKNYDEHFLPYYAMNVAVSSDVAMKIQDAWRDGTLYITLTRTESMRSQKMVERETGDTFINGVAFQIMTCEGGPPNVPDYQVSDISRHQPNTLMRLEAVPTLPMSMNKAINNGTFLNLRADELHAFLIAQNAPGGYPMLCAKADCTKVYETMMVPPLHLIPALRYIDRVYGVYKGKHTIFLDAHRGYFLTTTKNTYRDDQEPKATVLENIDPSMATNDEISFGSAWEDETKSFRVRVAKHIELAPDGPARREVQGENVKMVRATHTERVASLNKKLTVDVLGSPSGTKQNVVWQTYDNIFTEDKMRVENREQFSPITAEFSNINLRCLHPNLQWIVVTNTERTKPLEGAYRIKATDIMLKKAPGTTETMVSTAHVILVPSTITDE